MVRIYGFRHYPGPDDPGKMIKYLEINTGTVGVGHTMGTSEIMELENKWEGKLIEVTDRIDGMEEGDGLGHIWNEWTLQKNTSRKANSSGL